MLIRGKGKARVGVWIGVLCAVLAALAVGCLPRWQGYPPQPLTLPKGSFKIQRQDTSEAASGRTELPVADPESRNARYYSDLGPDVIDVAGYPAQQRYNYRVYAEVCSRCHTLARSINAPVASREFWEFYMLGMRTANRIDEKPPITAQERKAILDFLEYDSRVRKVEHARQFEAQTEELKRRYGAYLRDRLRRLQQGSQPVILQPSGH